MIVNEFLRDKVGSSDDHHGKVQDHENITDPDPHTTFTVVILYSCMYAQEVAVFLTDDLENLF